MTRRQNGATALLALLASACATSTADEAGVETRGEPTPAPVESLAQGAYSAEQAREGARVFDSVCGECHAAREFRGSDFFFDWEGSNVGRFVDLVVETMPEDDPGSLSRAQYLAVTAYVLELNGYPAGAAPLPDEAAVLSGLVFERPDDSTPDSRSR